MKAIVLTKIRSGQVEEAYRLIRRLRFITEAYMTFGPFDIVAVLEAGELSEIGRVVASEIQPIPGVFETLTCLAIECSTDAE